MIPLPHLGLASAHPNEAMISIQPLLWTGPRRVGTLSYSSAGHATRGAGHRAASVRQVCTMSRAAFLTTLEPPWTRMEPVRLGQVPIGVGTPNRFVAVESGEGPLLRVDLYQSSDECFAFEEVCVWSGFVVIGWGHRAYLVEPRTRAVSSLDLGSYFGHLYPVEQFLLVASAECLFRVEPDGSLLWRSDAVGIDGVVVDQVTDGIIGGKGEWDPPGDWRPFRVRLSTGQQV
jgi:hypothetical protein